MSRVEAIYDWAGLLVRDYVHAHYDPYVRVLDVGAGFGKYRILLREYANVDGCEVWQPTIDQEHLRELYRDVIVGDVYDVVMNDDWSDRYDLVIMGDVLEHLPFQRARTVVNRVRAVGTDLIVVVPFLYPQGEEHGNVYQRHIQDDLTPELMTRRYPTLRLIALETRDWKPFKGLYVGSTRG